MVQGRVRRRFGQVLCILLAASFVAPTGASQAYVTQQEIEHMKLRRQVVQVVGTDGDVILNVTKVDYPHLFGKVPGFARKPQQYGSALPRFVDAVEPNGLVRVDLRQVVQVVPLQRQIRGPNPRHAAIFAAIMTAVGILVLFPLGERESSKVH